MRYCRSCILPDTRPNLKIMDDGRCNACHSWEDKKINIDWGSRQQKFNKLIAHVKQKSKQWDCIIPVSGGKDSTWQVVKALEYRLKPLCVTWKTPARSKLGQKNLDNLVSLGVDHIDFTVNPIVEKKFTLEALKRNGSVAIPMHMALFAIPLQIAIKFQIPLVLWGENSGMEYGSLGESEHLGFKMTREWLKTYGVTQGTIAEDWINDNLSKKELSAYIWPSNQELENAGVTAAFLGWYFPWDPVETYKVAKQHGFEALPEQEPQQTGYYKFADIDDAFIISVHHWLKWYKFGFTRLWDNLSLEIRNGRIARDAAVDIIKQKGNEYPKDAIDKFCHWSGITESSFLNIISKFRNKDIWSYENNYWKIRNFLIVDWAWV